MAALFRKSEVDRLLLHMIMTMTTIDYYSLLLITLDEVNVHYR